MTLNEKTVSTYKARLMLLCIVDLITASQGIGTVLAPPYHNIKQRPQLLNKIKGMPVLFFRRHELNFYERTLFSFFCLTETLS